MMMLVVGASTGSVIVTATTSTNNTVTTVEKLVIRTAEWVSPTPVRSNALQDPSHALTNQQSTFDLLYPQQYHNSTQVEEELFHFNDSFPQLVDLAVIGKSWHNKSIWAMTITNESIPDEQKAHILFVAEHHARELITTEVGLRFILDLLNNANHEEVQFLLSHVVIHFIPVLNPDGLDDVVNNGHYWQRKNGRPIDDDGDGRIDEDGLDNPSFCGFDACSGQDEDGDGRIDEDPFGGVDLNRNYDFHWGDCPSGSFCNGDANESTISETYPGETPFSEPETRAFRDYVANLTVAAALSYHSGTNATLFPWGYPGLPPPPDKPIFDTIKEQLKQYLPASYWTGSVGYGVAGEWGDWYYATHGTITSTIEVFGNDDANDIYHYFNPDPQRIESLHQELLDFEYYWVSLAPILNISAESDSQNSVRLTVKNLSPALTTFESINADIQLQSPSNEDQNAISVFKPHSELLNASQSVEYFISLKTGKPGTYELQITLGNDWTGRTTSVLQLTVESGESNNSGSTEQGSEQTTPGFASYIIIIGLVASTFFMRRKNHKHARDR